MFTRLMESLAATEPVADIFSDASVIQAMLDFEAGLARAQAHASIIPTAAAEHITVVAGAERFDAPELARQALRAGTPAIPLVRMLTEFVREKNASAAGYVHWGATSQDVVDTATVLLLKKVRAVLAMNHRQVLQGLRRLSDEHAGTVMLGRTLLQPAPPVTFGLKAAGWFAAVQRSWARLTPCFDDALCLQLGGAAGTLASLEDRGVAVSELLAKELGLRCPDAPWHGQRDRLAALLAALSIYTASLGKMARDLVLLSQFEVGEVAEPGGNERGGSSTMPHKRNPTACVLTIAAAQRVPGLLANFIACMDQEHERGAGGWQAEWPAIEGIVKATGIALESMAEVLAGLTVDAARMRKNIDSTNGAVFAERAMMMLAPHMGRDAAHKLVEETIRKTGAQSAEPGLCTPEEYLGSAEAFRLRLLKGDR